MKSRNARLSGLRYERSLDDPGDKMHVSACRQRRDWLSGAMPKNTSGARFRRKITVIWPKARKKFRIKDSGKLEEFPGLKRAPLCKADDAVTMWLTQDRELSMLNGIFVKTLDGRIVLKPQKRTANKTSAIPLLITTCGRIVQARRCWNLSPEFRPRRRRSGRLDYSRQHQSPESSHRGAIFL